ncbi:phytanoyl-CoA dioxygenase family protein [Kitasatospora nipponensis]|uniref:Phytanoyl-CoA dioxygenase family protein n=1 Tax=Kitasatospora nipponensis TaxID=258049 RepID=A0ABN1W0G8_9ACTN
MTTAHEHYLDSLGATGEQLSAEQTERLDRDGYVVLPALLTPDHVAQVKESLDRIARAEGRMAGHEYLLCDDGAHRLHNLLNKDTVYDVFLTHPTVLAGVRHVLGSDFRLSMLNMRSQLPGQKRQKLHVDWYDGAEPNGDFKVCNAIWALDGFTAENGATRVVPGSHRFAEVPKQVLRDPYADWPGEVSVLAEPGDVILFNSHLWHRGMDNRSDAPRAGINSFFCRADQRPELDQDALLDAAARERMSPAALRLLGLA